MSVITPRMAALSAELAYEVRTPAKGTTFRLPPHARELAPHFDFDLENGPIKGVSGGFFSHLFHRTSGFALIGTGKGSYSGDHLIALRGTASLQDGITDLHVGVTGSETGSIVHAGFNKTFTTMKPAFQQYFSATKGAGTVHCVGHSLGGALAGLTADWLKKTYSHSVNLYTFGSPRVGLQGFSTSTTAHLDNIYRCTHGSDPVPKVPLWPFIHAPYNGLEYRLDSGQGFSPAAHKMGFDGNPGYLNSANSHDWGALHKKADNFLHQRVHLTYEDRHRASFTSFWADRISAALITLLKESGYYAAVAAQAAVGTALTFYDLVARTLTSVAQASTKLAKQTAGLIGHMLVFAGHGAVKVGELTYDFIKWVFEKTLNVLNRAVESAISMIS